ncbi:MAG: DNA-binding domain-containing protein [Sphingomonas sp.]
MSLLAMQRDMRAWLLRKDEAAATRLGVEVAPGLRVHQNNYRSQLVACLAETFPCTRDWIGAEAFEAALATHIDRVPPSSWTLDAYPRDLPATLAALYPADPEIAELAWLECALGEAFVAADAEPLSAADLGTIDWDSAVLRFTPTLDLGALTTNAPALWSALAHDEAPPTLELLPESGAILVWRNAQVSHFRAIDQVEHQALLWARAGMSFAELCEAMVASWGEQDGIARAGTLLGQWIADGLIVGIE